MGREMKAEKLEVIPVGEGKWAVTGADGVIHTVQTDGEKLTCNCPTGWNGRLCKHKRAVMIFTGEGQKAEELAMAKSIEENPGPAKGKVAKKTPGGYDFGEVTSAVQKSIRRGDEREAVYWALELYKTAPYYLIKRLLVIASEDIGMANPEVVGVVNSLAVGWAEAKKLSWYVSSHQPMMMVMLLCRAIKSTEVEDLIMVTELDVKEGKKREMPADAIDMHTQRGKEQAGARGESRDDMERFWYQGRLAAGIEPNQYTKELMERKPQWFVEPNRMKGV